MIKNNYRPDIQGLRAIAVIAVMLFHLNSAWLPGGFVGVDIFLVISGFLIASILIERKNRPNFTLTSTLRYFYTSRLKRIAPAYFSMLILVTLCAAIFFLQHDFNIFKQGLKKAAYFTSNNYFAHFGDYFAPSSNEQPLLHTWSLAVEIQFYLIAPLIFIVLPKKSLRFLLPLLGLALAGYAEYCLRMLGDEQATYFSLLARLPAFLLGAWVALLMTQSDALPHKIKSSFTWLALAGIIFALFFPKFTSYYPGLAGLVPIVGACLVIFCRANNIITHWLSNKFIVWIGALSYSLYLWHWPVLAFLRYYTGGEILNWSNSFLFLLVTVTLSIISFYFIETPLRQKTSKKQVIGYIVLATAVILTAISMKKVNAFYTPNKLPVEYTRYADPKTICHGKIIGQCLKGDLTSNKKILVLGDSHAAMLNHFFDYLGKELKFKAKIITASSCVTIPEFDYQRIPEWAQNACLNQIEEGKKVTEENQIIFLAASWNAHLKSELFNTSLISFLNELEDSKKEVFIIFQEPLLNNNPLRVYRFSNMGLPITITINKDYLKTNARLVELAERYEHIHFLDFKSIPLFKTPAFYEGKVTYFDEHHLNQVGAVEYAKEVLPMISDVLYHEN